MLRLGRTRMSWHQAIALHLGGEVFLACHERLQQSLQEEVVPRHQKV